MSRLVAFASAALFLEGLFFAALGPLLPELKADYGLSTSQTGLLAAAYVTGILVTTLPCAVASSRIGVKRTTIGGLVVLAAMSVALGVADGFGALIAAQFLAGVGGGAVWCGAMVWLVESSPPERRGAMIGATLGSSAAGQILGPVLGGVAATVGRAPTFSLTAAVVVMLGLAALRLPTPRSSDHQTLGLGIAVRSGRIARALCLNTVPGIVLGAVLVLAPLQLHHLGAGAAVVTVTFAISAVGGAIIQPIVGGWSDRVGRVRPIQIGLGATIPVLLTLAWIDDRWGVATLVVLGSMATRLCWGPVMTLLSDAADRTGVSQLLGLTLTAQGATLGYVIGSAGSGAIAQLAGPATAYAVAAAIAGVAALSATSFRDATLNPTLPALGERAAIEEVG